MSFLKIYKPESALATRWTTGVSIGALLLFGCYSLYGWVPASWRVAVGGNEAGSIGLLLGTEFPISWALLASSLLAIGALGGLWYALNFPRLVDFFVETESEMAKVSWSPWYEVIGSTIVVIISTIIFAGFIAVVDLGLVTFREEIPWLDLWSWLGIK